MNDIDRQIQKEEKNLDIQRRFDALERKIQSLESQIKTMGESNDTSRRLYFAEKLNDLYTAAPTYTPKTFKEQFAIYDTGGVRRLYIYINGTWRLVALS